MNKRILLPPLLAILLSTSAALAQQDNQDLRRAIESLKSAVNQLQSAVTQLEKAVADEPAPTATTLGDTPATSASGKLGPNETVFVGSDRYYHREGCAQIKPGVIQMTHSRAHNSYFTCTVCKPDTDGTVSYARGSLAPPPTIFGRPPTEQVAQRPSENLDTNVYINYGEVQYHFRGCPRIKPTESFERTLKQAKVSFMRCMTCGTTGSSLQETRSAVDPVNASGTVKPATRAPASRPTASPGRCQATTKKGTQCLRNAQSGRAYCWQHP